MCSQKNQAVVAEEYGDTYSKQNNKKWSTKMVTSVKNIPAKIKKNAEKELNTT